MDRNARKWVHLAWSFNQLKNSNLVHSFIHSCHDESGQSEEATLVIIFFILLFLSSLIYPLKKGIQPLTTVIVQGCPILTECTSHYLGPGGLPFGIDQVPLRRNKRKIA